MNVASVLFVVPLGPESIDVLGCASTVHCQVRVVSSTLPMASVANTWNVCEPRVTPLRLYGELQVLNEPVSTAHLNVTPASLEKWKLASVLSVEAGGPNVIAVVGGVTSTTCQVCVAGDAST